MIITATSDVHINHIDPYMVFNFIDRVVSERPDVVLVGGDLADGTVSNTDHIKQLCNTLLGCHKNLLYVPGNHDLYGLERKPPDEAFDIILNDFTGGTPLQTSWDDSSTIVEIQDALFIGSIGFPDFLDPRLLKPMQWYNQRSLTNDGTYIQLNNSWYRWYKRLLVGFDSKLKRVSDSDCRYVIILTHYPMFDAQMPLDVHDDTSAYFYNYTFGKKVLDTAKVNPDKSFYCISGHAHEHCLGRWGMVSENTIAYGIRTTTQSLDYIVLNTDDSLDRLLNESRL